MEALEPERTRNDEGKEMEVPVEEKFPHYMNYGNDDVSMWHVIKTSDVLTTQKEYERRMNWNERVNAIQKAMEQIDSSFVEHARESDQKEVQVELELQQAKRIGTGMTVELEATKQKLMELRGASFEQRQQHTCKAGRMEMLEEEFCQPRRGTEAVNTRKQQLMRLRGSSLEQQQQQQQRARDTEQKEKVEREIQRSKWSIKTSDDTIEATKQKLLLLRGVSSEQQQQQGAREQYDESKEGGKMPLGGVSQPKKTSSGTAGGSVEATEHQLLMRLRGVRFEQQDLCC